jgi:hypothetical protein
MIAALSGSAAVISTRSALPVSRRTWVTCTALSTPQAPFIRSKAKPGLGAGSEDLLSWLAAGPPPVFFGFGSMPVLEPEKVIGAVAEAARLTGLRILIGAGWSDLSGLAASLPDNVSLTGAINHDWLFPQCRAVIHHGGAGTTAAGLIAGRPTWIFTVFGDQPFRGHRVAQLGAGGYYRFTDLDLSHLTSALRALVRADVQQRASALGERLRAEDGLADAVRIIEKIAGQAPPPRAPRPLPLCLGPQGQEPAEADAAKPAGTASTRSLFSPGLRVASQRKRLRLPWYAENLCYQDSVSIYSVMADMIVDVAGKHTADRERCPERLIGGRYSHRPGGNANAGSNPALSAILTPPSGLPASRPQCE